MTTFPPSPRVLYVCWKLGKTSETFIAQVPKLLPLQTVVFEWLTDKQSIGKSVPLFQKVFPRLRRSVNKHLNDTPTRLYEVITQFRPHLLLCQTGPLSNLVLPVCQQTKTPLVTHFHGVDAYAEELTGANHCNYDNLKNYCAAAICSSQHMLSHLISQGWDSHKLKHISYHVNPSNFPLSSPHHSPKHFLSVGRLVEKKGGILTLVAFHQVLQKHPDATLTIIGDGPFGEIYRQYCRGVGLLDSVNFLGAQPHEVVAKEMAKARCFVQHSVTSENNDHEGTPVAIIEAQVSGLPVVATTHAGIPEAVIDGKTGFLVEEFDVDSMAARMSDFAANTYLAESFGKEARNSAVERFSFENTIGRIAKLACEVSRK